MRVRLRVRLHVRLHVRLGLGLLAAALAAACSTPVPGVPTAAPVPAPPALPLSEEDQQLAGLYAEVRTWDLCAAHDPEAAARVTGFDVDELVPYIDLGTCQLKVKERVGGSFADITLRTSVALSTEGGAPFDAAAGVTMVPIDHSTANSCAYNRLLTQGGRAWGLELSVSASGLPRPACEVVRDYATAIASRLADPPRRTAGATTPQLGLATADPCTLAAATLPALAAGAPVRPGTLIATSVRPYECGLVADVGAAGERGQRVRGSVVLAAYVGELTGRIAGRAAEKPDSGDPCRIVVRASEVSIQGNPGMPPTVEAAEFSGPCDRIDAMVEAAVPHLPQAAAPAPPPSGSPRALGDLDPPPTPASVRAPFDPCTVVTYADFPARVRPPGERRPVPMPVRPQDPYLIGCKFNAGEMHSSVVWGRPDGTFSADPAARPGSTAARFAGKAGVEAITTSEGSGPVCYTAVALADGIAAMVTSLPADPCEVNRAVMEQLAQRSP